MTRLILILLLSLASCSIEKQWLGVEELIFDSYKIREGEDLDDEPLAQAKVEPYLMVMGNASQSRVIALTQNAMPLRQVLAEVGANEGPIHIIRGALSKPKMYEVSFEHVLELPNDSLLVIPGDTISLR